MVILERLKNAICFLLLLTLFLTQGSIVYSQTSTPTPSITPTPTSSDSSNQDEGKVDNLQQQINDYQKKITELQGQEKTLSSQIKIMDNQMKVTELRIAETKKQIEELTKYIDVTKKRISGLEKDINHSTKALLGRISGVYQVGRSEPWEILLSSTNIDNFFTRLKYLRIVQIYDKKNIYAAEQSRVNYSNQKGILEEKQAEQQVLGEKLEVFTEQLEQEKKDKEQLLAVTKSSEKEYQKRLSDALRELRQIQKAAQVLVSTEPKQVTRGETIGLMGNTGYSFGAHLHFGIYNVSKLEDYDYYSNHENPASSLEGQNVDWGTGCGGDPSGGSNTGSGSFSWPMSTGGLHITQGYGHTCYSDVYYRGNPHPAYDMYNNGDITIKAVESGKAYFCRNCTGDGGNGVFIFHSNGKMSLYWHLQ